MPVVQSLESGSLISTSDKICITKNAESSDSADFFLKCAKRRGKGILPGDLLRCFPKEEGGFPVAADKETAHVPLHMGKDMLRTAEGFDPERSSVPL
jgi:hypothetical protein